MLDQHHQVVSGLGRRQSIDAGLSQAHDPAQALQQPEQGTELRAPPAAASLEQRPAPPHSLTPAAAPLLTAQPPRLSMQRGTAGPQQASGLRPLQRGDTGQPEESVGTGGVHPAAGQVPAGFSPHPLQSQARSPWPQLACASLSAWHQPAQPPGTATREPAAQAQARGLAEVSAAQAAFSFAPPQGQQPGGPQQWAPLPFFVAMQYQQTASRQVGQPVAGSPGQALSGLPPAAQAVLQQLDPGHSKFAAGAMAGAAAHGSPAGPLGQHVAAGPSLRQQGVASHQSPRPEWQDGAGRAGQLLAGDHHIPYNNRDSGPSDTSCPANSSMAAGQVPARLPGCPGPQASMQQRAAQLHSTLQQQAGRPSKATPEQTLTPQEVPAALHQAGHDQSVAAAAQQQRHSSSLNDLQGSAATAAAGAVERAPHAISEGTLHCTFDDSKRHGSPAEHGHKMGPMPQMGGRNSADLCLHRAGSSDLAAAAQDLCQQSQHRDETGAAAAVELQLQEGACNISVAETLLHNAVTNPGPAFEQGTGGGQPAAGQAASQDQEQLAMAKLHSGWWQQVAAAGVAAPSPRGAMPGQPPLGQGQPTGAGQLNGPVGTKTIAPVSHAPQASLPSQQSLAPASQAAHWKGQPAPQQAPSAVSQAGGVLLQQPEEGRAAEALPEEAGLGVTAAVAGADVEPALADLLWQCLPKEPVEQLRGELHS